MNIDGCCSSERGMTQLTAKIMKNLFTIILLAAIGGVSWAQNTFPSSGNVGIGTTSPSTKLHITSNNFGDFIVLDRTGNSYIESSFHITPSYDADQNDQLRIRVDGLDLIAFEETGFVGVGTNNPESNLHIQVADEDIATDFSSVLIEDTDAQIDVLSSSAGTCGSSINLIEGNGASNTNVWSMHTKQQVVTVILA